MLSPGGGEALSARGEVLSASDGEVLSTYGEALSALGEEPRRNQA